ncbi:hypothetical protein [Bdellovibrio sp. HCB209]|uniref:hypothetical protein n=1 Tax=Bdellovibrio sp. HCB209 TaxID=3394354 RepID=UPI0039B6B2A4
MNNVDIRTDEIALPEKEQLLVSCGRVLDKISARAPSDSRIKMSVDSEGDSFIVNVDLVSGELMISIASEARSPFMALEKADKAVTDRVMKWSATRQVETMPATLQ